MEQNGKNEAKFFYKDVIVKGQDTVAQMFIPSILIIVYIFVIHFFLFSIK